MIQLASHPHTGAPHTSAPHTSTPHTSTPYTGAPYTSTPHTASLDIERLGDSTAHTDCREDTERLGDEIARLAAHLHAATYRLLVLIREFDEREGWSVGFRSCADWLSWRTGIAPGASREKVRVARALAELPLLSEAMERGALSFSKARALTRVATAENEKDLLEVAEHATAAHIEKIVRAWRRVDRLCDAEAERERHASRYVRLFVDHDGMYVLRGRLDPEVGEVLKKALEAAGDALYGKSGDRMSGDRMSEGGEDVALETSAEQRRADAVGHIAERALSVKNEEDGRPVSRAERYQVVLHVEASATAGPPIVESASPPKIRESASVPRMEEFVSPLETGESALLGTGIGVSVLEDSGIGVSAETSRRISCDSSLVVMKHGPRGGVLDVGRKRRTVPPPIRRALDHRDGGCRFPGCGLAYTDAHHIRHWAEGGETKLENLTLLCRRHHRAVHEEGFRVELDQGGRPRFWRPDGKPLPSVPRAPRLGQDPVADLEHEHRSWGVTPTPHTTTPLWNGEPFDLGWAIYTLRECGR